MTTYSSEAAHLYAARHFESDIDGQIAEEAFIAGIEWRDTQLKNLLEAAEAYRDVYIDTKKHWDSAKYEIAVMQLLAATLNVVDSNNEVEV